MKKALILILVTLLLLGSVTALADISFNTNDIVIEGRNIDDLSLSELDTLASIVSGRIHRVQMKTGTVMKYGVYTVGKDIPAGFYRVSVTSRNDKELFTICTIEGTRNGTDTHFLGITDLTVESFYFIFKDGQRITIAGDDIVFAPYN